MKEGVELVHYGIVFVFLTKKQNEFAEMIRKLGGRVRRYRVRRLSGYWYAFAPGLEP